MCLCVCVCVRALVCVCVYCIVVSNSVRFAARICVHSYTYYQVQVPAVTNNDLYFVLTPFLGDPDLYINFGKTAFPNTTSSDMYV